MKRKFLRCSSLVNPNAVKRETIDGVEHVIVSSFTLPSDIVMNGIMYPGDEIEKSFVGLNRTLAPVEHPSDKQGNFVSASDPMAIANFYAGAYNDNAERVGDRVKVDKVINVIEAMKSERGKRLLDRIEELETSSDPRPIHTSTGIFLELEELDEPTTNAEGQEYSMVARNMIFDHDAILLDSVGAAQPHQGVGMAVNRDGKKMEVETITMPKRNAVRASRNLPLAASDYRWQKGPADRRVRAEIGAEDGRYHLWSNADGYKLPFVDIIDGKPHAVPSALRNAAARLDQIQGLSDSEKETIRGIIDGYLDRLQVNQTGLSYTSIIDQLRPQACEALNVDDDEWCFVEDVFDDVIVVETMSSGYFEIPYTVDNNQARLSGDPVAVDRVVSYQPKLNAKGDDDMRDMIINALKAKGIKVNEDSTDDELLAAYNANFAPTADADDGKGDGGEGNGGEGDAITQAVANAVKPLQDQVESLTAKLDAKADDENAGYISTIVNSKQYLGLDEDALKSLPAGTLKNMAANCGVGHGLPLNVNQGASDDAGKAPTEMPE